MSREYESGMHAPGRTTHRCAGALRARNGFEFDPWLAVKSERRPSRNPCGVRTRHKSTKRTLAWVETFRSAREGCPAFVGVALRPSPKSCSAVFKLY